MANQMYKINVMENSMVKDVVIASSINGICLTDLDGKLIYVNPSWLAMWGYDDNQEVMGNTIVKFWKSKGKYADIVDQVFDRGGWRGELVAEHQNGAPFFVQLTASLVKDKSGSPLCIMGSYIDITKEKEALKELHIKECAIEASLNPMALSDLSGKIIYANPSFLDLWRIQKRDTLKGLPLVKFWKRKGNYVNILDAVIEQGLWREELIAERDDGSSFPVQAIALLVRNEQGAPLCILASFNNVEHYRRTQQELQKKSALVRMQEFEIEMMQKDLENMTLSLEDEVSKKIATLKESHEEQKTTTTCFCHDLKNTLTSVQTLLPVLRNQVLEKDKALQLVELIQANIKYMQNFLIKGTYRTDQELIDSLKLHEVNLYDEINQVMQEQRYVLDLFQKQDITIKNSVDLKLRFQADQLLLQELLKNLLINAIKWTPPEGTITFFAQSNKEGITFSIKNTGKGMNIEQLNKQFEKKYKDAYQHGLDLLICKNIVSAHQGKIWGENNDLGKGTTIHVFWPKKVKR